MTQIIDGKKISAEIKDELKEKVAALKAEGKEITLAVIQVGNDPASTVYVGNNRNLVLISESILWPMSCRRIRQRENCFHW